MKQIKHFFTNTARPLVFGHRGFSALAPENTLPAFSLCRERGIPGIELDVQTCRTGELMISHDFDLKRTTGSEGIIQDMSFEEIRERIITQDKAEKYPPVTLPTLEEVLETIGPEIYLDIELKEADTKDTGLAGKVYETIKKHNLQGRCMVSSFNPFTLRRFSACNALCIPTAIIYSVSPDVPKFLQKGFGRHIAHTPLIKPKYNLLSQEKVTQEQNRRGYPIITWTVDAPEIIDKCLQWGVEGLIANNPENIINTIQKRTETY